MKYKLPALLVFTGFALPDLAWSAYDNSSLVSPAAQAPGITAGGEKSSVTGSTKDGVHTSEERIHEILDFWFGPLTNSQSYPTDKASLWFADDPDFDLQIQNLFGEDVHKASSGSLNSWRHTLKGRLALILLLERFPRRMYPNKPQAFLADAMARGLVIEGIQEGDDKRLLPIERAFFYMPLQNSEDLYAQNLSVELYTKLYDEAPATIKPQLEAFKRRALVNRKTIARFKRFPERNAVLGRQSTPEERLYINQNELLRTDPASRNH